MEASNQTRPPDALAAPQFAPPDNDFANGHGEDLSRRWALRWLLIILVVATVLRSVGLTYQLPVPSGPDHLGLIGVALRMGAGDLNPHWFTWPAAPFYFVAACYGAMFAACRLLGVVDGVAAFKQWFLDDPSTFYLYLRLIMVAIGLISVLAIYRVGCLLGSRRRGLLAAAMLAVTPVEVILCHYQKAEPMLVLTTILALAALIRWWQRESLGRAALAGAHVGLACAVKYNAALLVVPAVATAIRHALIAPADRRYRMLTSRLALGLVCLLAVFFALNPYLLLDAGEALRQLRGQTELMQAGRAALHRTPVRSYLATVFPVGFGWALYGVYAAGLFWLAVASIRRRGEEIVLVTFVLAYAAAMMTQKLVTAYYPLPMVPALALGAAGLVCQAARRTRLAAPAIAVILLLPAGRSLILDYSLALPNTSFQAEYWIRDHIPAGSRVARRHWLPPLLPAHARRLGLYAWPLEGTIRRDQVESFAGLGVEWIILTTRDTTGRQADAFGPADDPLAREARRFEAPQTLLPPSSGGVSIWRICRPAEAPPLARVYQDRKSAKPKKQLGVRFESRVELLGIDPLDGAPIRPGAVVELNTYWLVPAGTPDRLLITGELSGTSGVLADLTHELAYGIDAFVGRPADRECLVVHRMLVRPGYRAKAGRYRVLVGLRDQEGPGNRAITDGPGRPGPDCTIAEITVEP